MSWKIGSLACRRVEYGEEHVLRKHEHRVLRIGNQQLNYHMWGSKTMYLKSTCMRKPSMPMESDKVVSNQELSIIS